jgi:aldehyde dehydrogenase (NAD+)
LQLRVNFSFPGDQTNARKQQESTPMTITPPQVSLHIGGVPHASGSGGTHQHLNPVTGKVQATIPLAGPAEIGLAVTAAEAVRESWRLTPPEARRQMLNMLADLIDDHAAEFAQMAALDGGTALSMGARGAGLAAMWTRYYAGWCDKLSGEMISTFDTRGELAYTVPEPIGIVGIIITWNGPLISLGMKVAPALAAGNCVIVKPAEITPFAPELFARLVKQAGFPDGVFTLLPGTGAAGDALVRHKRVELISFTGGPITARKIMIACAEMIKPSIMELGGKSASLVFPDCDFEAACQNAVFGTIAVLSGQGCALPTRQLVHADIYDRFVARVTELTAALKVGDPFDPDVTVGPVINAAAVERIMGMFERMTKAGSGRFLLGGKRCGGALAEGNFIEPTIIVDADPDAEISQVEIFGPALVIMKFHDEDEAVRIANNSDYGLAAYIQTNNLKRAHALSERLYAGGVYINGGMQIMPHTPFGGIGISGFGKEGGRAGIDAYLRYKTVTIA